MKLEKEQKTQFIVLCVLLVVVIGFGAYRMASGTGTSANSTPAKTASSVKASAGQASGDGTTSQPTLEETAKATGYVNPVKDPFEPQDVPNTVEPAIASTKPTSRLPLITREPKMTLPVMPSFDSEPAKITPAPVAVEQVNPTKDLKLTGIIEGDTCVAIIRAGDARHIVREGQSIDGRLFVRSISRAGVRLSFNGRSYFLALSSGKDS